MPGLAELIGTTYGPFSVTATRERVEAFVSAIGGDPSPGPGLVHPMFANAVLFAAAPAFLDDPRVRPFTTSLIHSDQTFEWHGPAVVESRFEVTGTVETVRARGPLQLVTFSVEASSENIPWLSGSSVFLMSEEPAGAANDAEEPDVDERPPVDIELAARPLPVSGTELESVRCGASRADLMRYAAASGDWNPIHYDHDSARQAGLGGVIVHGLLMAAWLGRVAERYGSLAAMKLRFRNPLRPAVQAFATGVVVDADPIRAELALDLVAGETRLVTSRAWVTR